ncbi:hypothetical protein CLI92_05825 [Vandammella animalimorsus]|uniref:DUF935 domain-containing protein n=1 Tax=Vandammella animalimorsus TaxID=2029117 RepID=A0A2A2T5Z1_9BURK|nr:DUF935 family protein [Vandammella animalimorsus]PAX17063.1 hypothetical protein CLI92_05825 [Vandammella animalimorsus]PAX19036.1 hypothetical protein CLI93_09755 [Vandammella animalimorsus]
MSAPGLYLPGGDFVRFSEAPRRLGASMSTARPLSAHIATRQRGPDFVGLGMWLPNPDPILKRQGKDIAVYRELRSDAHTGGCIRRRKAAVRALEWRVERDRASARMHKVAQAVLEQLDLDALIDQMLDATLYGWQPLEILWQQRPGQAPTVQHIVGKPPEWFLFDADARLRFRSREHPLHGELLPERKFLLARQEASYANPYGFADLSMCFWPVTFKRGGLRYWVKFAEKYGSPWAVGKQPRNSPQPESDRLLEQLEAMIEDAVAVIPDDASVEMIQAAGSSGNASAYELLLKFCRSEVAIALLGQNQSTEADSTRASATAGLDVATDIRDGDKRLVEGVINSQLLRWIVDLHEGEGAPAPRFVMWQDEEVSKAQAERDEILSRAIRMGGLSPEYFKRVYELEDGDLPEQPETPLQPLQTGAQDLGPYRRFLPAAGADVPAAAQKPALAFYKTAPAALFAEPPAETSGVQPGDTEAHAARLAAQLAPAGQAIVADWMRRIEQHLSAASDWQQLQQRIASAFDELPEDALVEVMHLAMTAARLAGMHDVQQEARP